MMDIINETRSSARSALIIPSTSSSTSTPPLSATPPSATSLSSTSPPPISPTSPRSLSTGRKLSVIIPEDRRRSTSCAMHTGRVVLVAVDQKGHSMDAFHWFLSNVWNKDDLVVIAYCPEPPNLPSFKFKKGLNPPTEKWLEIMAEKNEKVKSLEDDYQVECVQKKMIYKIRTEQFSCPEEGILKIAEEEKANMIVMGSRTYSGIRKLLKSSVSETVLRNSKIPCIIVPA